MIKRAALRSLHDRLLGQQFKRQRLVTDSLEQDDNLVAVESLYDAFAPLAMADGTAVVVRLVHRLIPDGAPRIAVVAVAARCVELLAEVVEQVLPTARANFRIAAHHDHGRLVERP